MSEKDEQDVLFDAVKAEMGTALPANMQAWSAADLRNALRKEIEKLKRPQDGHHFRYYHRRHLRMTGDHDTAIRGWVAGSVKMTADQMRLVAETLVERPVVPGEREVRATPTGGGSSDGGATDQHEDDEPRTGSLSVNVGKFKK